MFSVNGTDLSRSVMTPFWNYSGKAFCWQLCWCSWQWPTGLWKRRRKL